MMKAIVINSFGGPEKFEISDVPKPEIHSKEILVEVFAGSVNPIDWKQRKGKHRFIFGAPFPIVLGYDVSGIIVKKGESIKEFDIGDKVCGVLSNKYGGGLGEFAKGTERCFSKVPVNVDLKESAALPLAGLTAFQALRDHGKIKPGDRILIIGAAGGVGHYAIQIAGIMKAEIYTVSSSRHASFVQELAHVYFIDYAIQDILKTPTRFHVIFDVVGKYSFLKCMHLLLPGGIYINTLPRPKILIHKVVSWFTKGKKVKTFLMKHSSSDLQQLLQWVSKGSLKIAIDKKFFINDISKAHEYSEKGHTEGKILVHYKE